MRMQRGVSGQSHVIVVVCHGHRAAGLLQPLASPAQAGKQHHGDCVIQLPLTDVLANLMRPSITLGSGNPCRWAREDGGR